MEIAAAAGTPKNFIEIREALDEILPFSSPFSL